MLAKSGTAVLTDTQKVLAILETSDMAFYQTGSRFFGGTTSKSDYDFFVQDEPFITTILEGWGFYRLTHGHNYNDNQCVAVYRKEVEFTHIDIQIIREVDVKIRAQEILKASCPGYVRRDGLSMFPGQDRRGLWEMAYKMAILERRENALTERLDAIQIGIDMAKTVPLP